MFISRTTTRKKLLFSRISRWRDMDGIWLPARKTNFHLSGQYEDGDDNVVPARWVGVSAH
jgi:hypothetical protein